MGATAALRWALPAGHVACGRGSPSHHPRRARRTGAPPATRWREGLVAHGLSHARGLRVPRSTDKGQLTYSPPVNPGERPSPSRSRTTITTRAASVGSTMDGSSSSRRHSCRPRVRAPGASSLPSSCSTTLARCSMRASTIWARERRSTMTPRARSSRSASPIWADHARGHRDSAVLHRALRHDLRLDPAFARGR